MIRNNKKSVREDNFEVKLYCLSGKNPHYLRNDTQSLTSL